MRTDSAGVFFGMLGLWLCLRLHKHPTVKNQVLAGLAIGLGISTRYFMVALIPVLLAVDASAICRRTRRRLGGSGLWLGAGAGLLAVAIGFALSTPYFFLDFTSALESLRVEARSSHLGADGLSPVGNFLWYLTRAIPLGITWPQAIMAAIGVVVIVWNCQFEQMLLLGFTLAFLLGISSSPLHWHRWIIQILPLLGLFAANALSTFIGVLNGRLRLTPLARQRLMISALLLLSAWPLYQLVLLDIRHSRPSTRILAREWILHSLPSRSLIAQEWYTAPLYDTDFSVFEQPSLAQEGWTLDDYRHKGYHYLVVSSAMYDRYLAEPERYSAEVAFYQTLFDEGLLLKQFHPSPVRRGSVIRIYELQDP